ncbi:MAG: 16S rRNA (cytidine(1402)-2'-O)-methyltransferase [Lachnospiraceae bacterium]|nr:16S rRNA (cytidine(1402)-2'-O)-methyltransferase [Lachnospiraceae bacterium]
MIYTDTDHEPEKSAGMLYLCATPIGNLSDITDRVKETLKNADIIAAEDTRNTLKLLNHLGIKAQLVSYHEHNKYDRAAELADKMEKGLDVALVTDAGTPGISDPGEVITKMCYDRGIRVTSLPGPCALVTALSLSGLPARRFVFEGFLPGDRKERHRVLEDLRSEIRTIVIYESPHHLKKTLSELLEVLGDRETAICRELTKKFESVERVRLSEADEYYKDHDPRGEYVLIIKGLSREQLEKEKAADFLDMGINEHMAVYEDQGIDHKEAMKMVAKDRGISRREVYQMLLDETNDKRS